MFSGSISLRSHSLSPHAFSLLTTPLPRLGRRVVSADLPQGGRLRWIDPPSAPRACAAVTPSVHQPTNPHWLKLDTIYGCVSSAMADVHRYGANRFRCKRSRVAESLPCGCAAFRSTAAGVLFAGSWVLFVYKDLMFLLSLVSLSSSSSFYWTNSTSLTVRHLGLFPMEPRVNQG